MEAAVLGSCEETSEPLVDTELEDPDDPGPTQPMHKSDVVGNTDPAHFHAAQDKTPDALHETFQNLSENADTRQVPDACGALFQNFLKTPDNEVKANSPESPMSSSVPLSAEGRRDMPDRFPNHTELEDPSLLHCGIHADNRSRLGRRRCQIPAVRTGPVTTLLVYFDSSRPGSFSLPSGAQSCALVSSISLNSAAHGLPWPYTPNFAGLSVPEPPPHTRHRT